MFKELFPEGLPRTEENADNGIQWQDDDEKEEDDEELLVDVENGCDAGLSVNDFHDVGVNEADNNNGEKEDLSVTKIFFCSRTHSQV